MYYGPWSQEMSRLMTNQQNDYAWSLPAKTQINLGICPIWSESSLRVQQLAKDPAFFMRTVTDAQADLSLCWVHMPFCFVMRWLKCPTV